ncbi:HypC/HybG/HupF family hydrogenase formation chaperone [Desulfolutivibrio sulfoxidireducens]|uniref:HypC/HybG/HupF family hydrogenase formation chaperone n=1 Tax=Desulfolutivibrio sulfoxidireducens TaxID=2773299 RepID=UPI00159D2AE1|nr:HypC/HybG/HupF family hydrogenase formation chaperone [Desulfolutivibrio sulfoxidireducens]QLA16833.1 HypC/HybG/HupF family hydrogenase formation chaperone [Desulfolutivibrio sulfoxidireducens]QLA20397.1 HypC/HybG/HupF family hydrogenase formation chaperone [Desulfolutivibrio sulfoxidireducens]
MCLAVPMEIVSIADNVADVEIGGVKRQVRLDIIDEAPAIGDYVIVHAGFALRRLDREDALETIKLFQEGLNLELL